MGPPPPQMPEPRPSDKTLFARPPPAAASEALACELAMLEATLPPLPVPAAGPPQRVPPREDPERVSGR